MTWKLVLYDFIHARNQMEADCDWNSLRAFVEDEAYLYRTRLLQERRQAQRRKRGLSPIRSETRLVVRNVREADHEAEAEVRLNRQFHVNVAGFPITEEKVEFERITLRNTGGIWKVSGVETEPWADRDNSGNYDAFPSANEGPDILPRQPAAPFLNRKTGLSPASKPGGRYNREMVRQYAEQWWNSHNPQFLSFENDCSNYVSQCILAGGLFMDYTGRRESGWWYRGMSGGRELWSYSWAVANALQLYLSGKRVSGLRAEIVDTPRKLDIGDVIGYSWEGDGKYGHSTVVTGFDGNGMPLVNAHTVDSRNRYWDYSDSYAWTERTKYRFFHIPDKL